MRIAFAFAAVGLLPLGHAAYLHAKAELAQVLLEHAWQQALANGGNPQPWPWADTTPVARIGIARLGVEQIVLSGDSGRTLAFGPGWAPSSTPPGAHGLVVISAHRDTHFAFLRKLVQGDSVMLDTRQGSRRYRVSATQIVDVRHDMLPAADAADGLLLVTCYPFDALVPGGPLRYVVSAVADDAARVLPPTIADSTRGVRDAAIASR